MTDPEPDALTVPVLPPAPVPFDLAGELFAMHQARLRRLDEARAERAALAKARVAGLVKRHETKLSRNAAQRALTGDQEDQ